MTKSTLKRLGQLWKIKCTIRNLQVDEPQEEEWHQKHKLVTHVKKQLEEQKRGFLKSKVNYSLIADFIIESWDTQSYQALHLGIKDIVCTN